MGCGCIRQLQVLPEEINDFSRVVPGGAAMRNRGNRPESSGRSASEQQRLDAFNREQHQRVDAPPNLVQFRSMNYTPSQEDFALAKPIPSCRTLHTRKLRRFDTALKHWASSPAPLTKMVKTKRGTLEDV
eukprot:gb/GFBE01073578.1/.p1 GENE.gb/GFBE01073578.1/~~gb/GFBE01073578.1/.p1  ORF type:complete len:130 (+),score=18.05 gb/GFBE01073578.1/:1-390(+)